MTTAPEPAWLLAARALIGTREAAGPANNPTIIGWATRLGAKVLGMTFNADSTPWCGLFVAHCMKEAGIPAAPIAVRAKAWATWGEPRNPIIGPAAGGCAPGVVLVFGREGGGHVGFYVGEDRDAYHVLGGNQGDRVSIARIAKDRLIAARWPKGVAVTGGPVRMTARAGVPLSRNEA